MVFKGKSILVTGGTGSFGQAFVKAILDSFPHVHRLVIFSRDELKQFEMSQKFPEEKYPQIRYFLGDVRDKQRLLHALEGIDTVVHAAALKQVPAAEYNPFEFIKTNILGAQNLVEAAIEKGVQDVVALSTDKAAAPVNLYGATKLCSDKLFVAANLFKGPKPIKFSVVRYGNVMCSRGSVIPFFRKIPKGSAFPVTDKGMTRFNITLDQGVDMVLWAMENAHGGEIFVPKIPSYRICDLVEALQKDGKIQEVGMRPGEKLHEEMITVSDSSSSLDLGKYYVILPSYNSGLRDRYIAEGATPCPQGFSYNSGDNNEFLSVADLRRLIGSHYKD